MSLSEIPTTPYTQTLGKKVRSWRNYEWLSTAPYFIVQILGIGGLFVFDATWQVWALCIGLYLARMFFVTAAYHRYFAHRTYKMGRVMQFLFALGAETTAQRGVLWWAAHHRDHHKFSDEPEDVHSLKQYGFWHSHMMWIYDGNSKTNYARVKDLAKFPRARRARQTLAAPPGSAWVHLLLRDGPARALHWVLLQHDAFVARHVHDQLALARVGQAPVQHLR